MFQRYEGMRQDDLGIWSSPSGARVAWFSDPEGNTLSLTEFQRPTSKKKQRKRNDSTHLRTDSLVQGPFVSPNISPKISIPHQFP